MKIAIVNLTGGGLSNGYIKYLFATLPRWRRHPRVSEVRTFVPAGFAAQFEGILPPAHLQECDYSLPGRRRLRQEILRAAPDVVLFPCNRWLEVGIPSVAMVRSMLPMVMPLGGNGWLDIIKNIERARASKIASRRARRVIAVSNYVKEFLESAWRIPPEKIGVVYHGVNPSLAPEAMKIPAGVPPEWRGEFLFTAGSMHPYRALEDALQALAVLASRGVRPPLVVAGGADRTQLPYFQRMRSLAGKLGVDSQIAWTGHLDEAEMSWCYANCRLFLMTSRVEACPNIALEAMSYGVLALAADNPPLPEIFQEAAVYYRPRHGEALAQVIGANLEAAREADGIMRRQAKKRAGDFTWEKTVELTLHELELAISHAII